MESSKRGTSLLAFPVEVLDEIASHLVQESLRNLLLVGNRSLSARLCQISTIVACWMSSSFCDWRRSMPFVNSFSKLQALTLTVNDAYNRPSEVFQPTWPALLPSTLKSLSLDYRGALDVLTGISPFYRLQSLTYLSIYQEIPLLNEGSCTIQLLGLPSSLKHLILHSEVKGYGYILEHISALPRDLITFDVNLESYCMPSSQTGHFRFLGDVDHPSSLTHLGISFQQPAMLDIANCSANLRYLRAPAALVSFDTSRCTRLTSTEGTPIRDILPCLHTLILTGSSTTPWELFECLPLTLTRLGALLDLDPTHTLDNLATGRRMNESHRSTAGGDRSGAPMMVRRLEIPDLTIEAKDELLQFLPLFPSLESIELPQASRALQADEIGVCVRSIEVTELSGPLALLPRSLQKITCSSLDLDLKTVQGLLVSPLNVPRLSSLSVSRVPLHLDLISLLPTSLEHLRLVIPSQESLEALAVRCNQMPFLTSLIVRVSGSPPPSHLDKVQITVDYIPLTLKSLTLRGTYELPLPPSNLSLAHHPRLTALHLRGPSPPLMALSQLPEQLIRLSITLSAPVDLNNPTEVNLLMSLPKGLHEVHISSATPRSGLNTTTWFTVANPASLRSLGVRSLTQRNTRRFHLMTALPSWLVSESMRYLVSESFAVSCLPKTVNHFEAPYASNRSMMMMHKRITALQSILERRADRSFVALLQRLVQYRLPLLGLLMPNTYAIDVRPKHKDARYEFYQEERLRALPPNLSFFDPHCSDASETWQRKIARSRPEVDLESKPLIQNRFTFRALFHGMNLAIWLHLSFMFSFEPRSTLNLIRWNHIIGSALALPLQFLVHRPALRGYLPPGNDWAHTLLGASLVGIIFIVPVWAGLWLSSFASVSSQLKAASDPWDKTRWFVQALFILGEVVTNTAIATFADQL